MNITTTTVKITEATRRPGSPLSTATLTNRPVTSLITFPKAGEIPEKYSLSSLKIQDRYLGNGELKKWTGARQAIYSPICEEINGALKPRKIGEVPSLTRKESLEALASAERAYGNGVGVWPMMSTEERIKCVETFLTKIASARDETIKYLMWETCKNEIDATKEFDRTVTYLRNTISEVRNLEAESKEVLKGEGTLARLGRSARGVTLCMGPFNYPLNETFTTLFPALLMGNPVIVKPAKYGVLLLDALLPAFKESFPAGAVNFIYGDGAEVVGPLMESGKISVLAFIGSGKVADILIKQHPHPRSLHCVLGLGAKNPALFLKGSNLKETVKEFAEGALNYMQQRCTAPKIAFVPRSEVEEFLGYLTNEVSNRKAGMPWTPGVSYTPLAEAGRTDEMARYVKDGEQYGAAVINPRGGEVSGTYFHPAIVYPVNEKMRLYREEQFGPIIPVVPYDDISEVMNWVATSPYKQQACIFGGSKSERFEVVSYLAKLQCRANLDTQPQRGPDFLPFTAKGDSGQGTLSIREALMEFSVPSLIATKERFGEEELRTFNF